MERFGEKSNEVLEQLLANHLVHQVEVI